MAIKKNLTQYQNLLVLVILRLEIIEGDTAGNKYFQKTKAYLISKHSLMVHHFKSNQVFILCSFDKFYTIELIPNLDIPESKV